MIITLAEKKKISRSLIYQCEEILKEFNNLPNKKRETLHNFVGSPMTISYPTGLELINEFCQITSCEKLMIFSKTRTRKYTELRQIIQYLLYKHLKLTTIEVGNISGGRDHSTIVHSTKTVKDLMVTDIPFKKYVLDIEKKLLLKFGL